MRSNLAANDIGVRLGRKAAKKGEHLLLIKTLPGKWDEVRDFITANHSYDTPEIVAIDAERVSKKYRAWIDATLT